MLPYFSPLYSAFILLLIIRITYNNINESNKIIEVAIQINLNNVIKLEIFIILTSLCWPIYFP
jgi:hypothetical protein